MDYKITHKRGFMQVCRKIASWIIEPLFIILLVTCIIYHELAIYGLSQLRGQLHVVYNTIPVEKALQDNTIPDTLKQKMILIDEIKKYAVDSLGIHPSKSYTTYYDQRGRATLWVLTASEPYQLKAYQWRFPFLGVVTYKGFFDKSKGRLEQEELNKKGFDTDFGKVGGWSTLGWFKDPVLSSMLARKEGSLASLVIHELTHGTLFVKSNVDFNENLANFVGHKGALLFLTYKYGKDSKEYNEYVERTEDNKVFKQYMLNSAARLDQLYKGFTSDMPKEEKEKLKTRMIAIIANDVKHLPLHRVASYEKIAREAIQNKNAFFITFKQYDSQQELFEKEFQEKGHGRLKDYLIYLKKKYPSL